MLKKILLTLLILTTTLPLSACGDEEPVEEQVVYEKRTGIVRTLGVSIYQEGTHRFERNGKLAGLLEPASSAIDLDDFLDEEVEVEGIVSSTIEGNLEIIKVIAITPIKADDEESDVIGYQNYADSQFGFTVKYPGKLTAKETRRGVQFADVKSEEKIVEVVVLENKLKQDLSEWLVDNYGYANSDLTQVSVAGMIGYKFQNATGNVIYLGRGTEVFTLVWYDNDEVNRARNRRYYLEIVQSFTLGTSSGTTSSRESLGKAGEFCGGVAGVECASGLECRLSGSYPDAGGICVQTESSEIISQANTADQIPDNSDLPKISSAELQRGWYYGDKDQKKPGTPDTWIIVDSGTRSAMWRRLNDSAPEVQAVELPEANTEASALSSTQQKVFEYLQTSIATYAPEYPTSGEWKVVQLAFADPSYVYAIYSAGDQTRRLLFVYAVTNGEVALTAQAYFKPGDTKDWLALEGSDSAFGKALTIVDATGAISTQILEGYRQFTNTRQNYSLQYPKNWYWQNATLTRTEFADKPFPAAVARITAEVVDGSDFAFDELKKEGEKNVLYVQMSSEKSLKISSYPTDAEIIKVMGETFEINN